MELAGVQAVCDFHGWDLYNFLATGDVLDQAVYDVSGLANANNNMDKLYIAIEKGSKLRTYSKNALEIRKSLCLVDLVKRNSRRY